MDITDIKIFKDFYIYRNLTEVSKLNYITQPSVSYRLGKMQEELKTKLYEYNGEYIFTDSGKLFYEYCIKAFDEYQKITERVQKKKHLAINVSTTAVYLYLPELYDLLQEYHLSIEFLHSDAAIRNVVEGRSFFSIIGGINMELPKFILCKILREDRINLLFNKSLSDNIEDIPIILDERSSGLYKLVKDYLNNLQNYKIVAEIGTAFEKVKLIECNPAGIFISGAYIDEIMEKSDAIVVSQKYYFKRKIYILFHSKNENHPIIKSTIERLK